MLYISTDYVFDGKSPPYAVNAVPSPLNLYGKTKLNGEEATLATGKGNITSSITYRKNLKHRKQILLSSRFMLF
jgi:dTDP-4-dehydrorhamnose reductase